MRKRSRLVSLYAACCTPFWRARVFVIFGYGRGLFTLTRQLRAFQSLQDRVSDTKQPHAFLFLPQQSSSSGLKGLTFWGMKSLFDLKYYQEDDVLPVGERTLRFVAQDNPDTINWLLIHDVSFCLSSDTLCLLRQTYDFHLSSSAQKALDIKLGFTQEAETEFFLFDVEINQDNNISAAEDINSPEHYGEYKGSYAQDYEHLSDDFIDTVLEGDPEAYWNID